MPLFDFQNYDPYRMSVSGFDPNKYLSTSPETRANRGIAGGGEEKGSAIASGIASALGPIGQGFMAIGKGGYDASKSTNSSAGDFFANAFGPHHELFGSGDDYIADKKRGDSRSAARHGNMWLSQFLQPPGSPAGFISAIIRGKEKRQQAAYNHMMLQNDHPFDYAMNENGIHYASDIQYQDNSPARDNSGAGWMAAAGAIGGMAGNMFGAMKKTDAPTVNGSTLATPSAGVQFNNDQNQQVAMQTYKWNAPNGYQGDSVPISLNNGNDTHYTWNFMEGGMMDDDKPVLVAGGGAGTDTVALVDANTGQDTGKRVNNGEMLVINKEVLSALKSALGSGDHKKVFSLVEDQMGKSGEVKDGNVGFKKGGIDGGAGGSFETPEDNIPLHTFITDSSGSNFKMIRSDGHMIWAEVINGKYYRIKDADKIKELNKKGNPNYFSGTHSQDPLSSPFSVNINQSGAPAMPVRPVSVIDAAINSYHKSLADPNIPPATQRHINDKLSELEKEKRQAIYGVVTSGDTPGTSPIWSATKQTASTNPTVTSTTGAPVVAPAVTNTTSAKKGTGGGGGSKLPAGHVSASWWDKFNSQADAANQPTQDSPAAMFNINDYFPDQTGAAVNIDQTAEDGTDATGKTKTPFQWSDMLGNAFDAYRMFEGMQGANSPIPEFHKGVDWNEFVGRLKAKSFMGLTPEQKALAQTNMDRAYRTQVSNIYNLSGGSNAIALGNLGSANMAHYDAGLNLAALDANQMDRNVSNYGAYLGQDVKLNRMIFGDNYNQAVMNKQSGANLASNAILNMKERAFTNEFYGPKSMQQKLIQAKLDEYDYNKMLNMAAMKYYKNPAAWNYSVAQTPV